MQDILLMPDPVQDPGRVRRVTKPHDLNLCRSVVRRTELVHDLRPGIREPDAAVRREQRPRWAVRGPYPGEQTFFQVERGPGNS